MVKISLEKIVEKKDNTPLPYNEISKIVKEVIIKVTRPNGIIHQVVVNKVGR